MDYNTYFQTFLHCGHSFDGTQLFKYMISKRLRFIFESV